MSSADTMSKNSKVSRVRISKRVSGGKAAFWNGVFEGFSGPLMMGTPVKGGMHHFVTGKEVPGKETDRYVTITLGNGTKFTGLGVVSKAVGRAMFRATEKVMDANNLVYQKVPQKTLDADGKFRTVEHETIVPRPGRPSNEPRK